ncbi:MAG: SdrD B-like domain-containing protein [Candidatus Methanoperedens sp.]
MGLNSKGIKERISLLAGISVFLLILGASAATAGSISGVVFNDANQNGVMDAGEPGLPGWAITITGLVTSYTTSATTDASGYYTFPDLAPDLYVVAEALQPGWTLTAPLTGTYGVDLLFTDPTRTVTDLNFGNTESISPPSPSSGIEGKMTGGGSVGTANFAFELNCNVTKKPMGLEINWGKNKFHLEELTSASCSDDAAINPEKPSASFDTYTGAGTGSYNKLSGYTASWTFKDAGEPGINDWFSLQIKDSGGVAVLDVSGTLKDGNIQAHDK